MSKGPIEDSPKPTWGHLQFQEQDELGNWSQPYGSFCDLPSTDNPDWIPSRAVCCTLDGRVVEQGSILELAFAGGLWAKVRFCDPQGTKGYPRAELMLAGDSEEEDPGIIRLPSTSRLRWPLTKEGS